MLVVGFENRGDAAVEVAAAAVGRVRLFELAISNQANPPGQSTGRPWLSSVLAPTRTVTVSPTPAAMQA